MTASRWLWITPEIRDELTTGALVYSMNLARAIADEGVAMTMVGIGSELAPSNGIERITIDGELRGGWRSILSTLPNLAYACALDSFVERVRALLDEPWDVVVVDGLQAAWASSLVAAAHPGPSVFIAHNHEASLRWGVAREATWRSGKRIVLGADALKAARLERASARAATVITAITAEDAARLRRDAPDSTVIEITPGWSGEAPAELAPTAARPRRVGIMGSFEWHVKQENLRRFVAIADPIFAAAGVELVIGGKMPDDFREEVGSGRTATTIVGWVDDPAEFLGRCRLGVIAEPLGGGFKLKSLDYVFHGVPLACLRDNAAGLPLEDGASMFESTDAASLARRVVAVIDDTDLLDAVATAAIDVCTTRFSWSQRGRALTEAVDGVRP